MHNYMGFFGDRHKPKAKTKKQSDVHPNSLSLFLLDGEDPEDTATSHHHWLCLSLLTRHCCGMNFSSINAKSQISYDFQTD